MNNFERLAEKMMGNAHIRQGDGFWYAVKTDDQSKTVMRGNSEASVKKKLIKAGYAIIPEE